MPHSTHGTIVLMGSGEMAASMVEVHKYAMSLVEGPLRAAFIDTPAGFQLNADLLAGKAVEYFVQRLNTPLEVVSFKDAGHATSEDVQAAVRTLHQTTYVFAGPGSPTYAIRNWRGTPIYDAMFKTLTQGGCLTFASAAALTLGRLAIPVYEIYKVGTTVHWVEGLDITGHSGLEVAIVPHWNNTSGGDHDTRFCFMGEPRWRVLESRLPDTTAVLGIDEHTACILRIDSNIAEVRGVGTVTVRRAGREQVFSSGDAFSLDLLRPAGSSVYADSGPALPESAALGWETIRARHDALLAADQPSVQEIMAYIYDVLSVLSAAREHNNGQGMLRAEETLREALVDLLATLDAPAPDVRTTIAPYVDLLLEARADLRALKQWELSDRIRDRLLALGLEIQDTPEGARWRLPGA
jgi:cyanophycinase-like exopeptidase